jgi:hypothetical protein
MTSELREAWTNLIQAADYEVHMASVGQAQANAKQVEEYFLAARLARGVADGKSMLALGFERANRNAGD